VCGIIGYVGQRACKELLLQGLERLEYRGYDSAGLALREDDQLDYVRVVGNLQALKRETGSNGSQAATGLGHTRWATHGAVNEQNAHPLTGCDESKMAVVLNGIVENYRELREELQAAGHTFSSETDAEVVAHLIEDAYDGDLVGAMRAVDVAAIDAPAGSRLARVSVNVRNELIYDLTGGGGGFSPTHRLDVKLTATQLQVIVDINTARPDVNNYGIDSTYTLTELATGRVVVKGQTFARVSYNIPGQEQRFAGERGLRDAENRAAREISENIRNRLASFFVAGT